MKKTTLLIVLIVAFVLFAGMSIVAIQLATNMNNALGQNQVTPSNALKLTPPPRNDTSESKGNTVTNTTVNNTKNGSVSTHQNTSQTQTSTAAAGTIIVSATTVNSNVGQVFPIYVLVNTPESIFSASLEATYDSNYVEFVSFTKGDFFSKDGVQTFEASKNKTGDLVYATTRVGTTKGVSGQGTIVTLNFKARNTGTSVLYLQNLNITDIGSNTKPRIVIRNPQIIIG